MRAVSPETESTAFFMGWMGEAAHKAIRTCTTVCVGLYFLMCQPALPYLQVRTNVSTRLHERICKFTQAYLQVCTNVSTSLYYHICKPALPYARFVRRPGSNRPAPAIYGVYPALWLTFAWRLSLGYRPGRCIGRIRIGRVA